MLYYQQSLRSKKEKKLEQILMKKENFIFVAAKLCWTVKTISYFVTGHIRMLV